jgi:gliding motility-associated-like protein
MRKIKFFLFCSLVALFVSSSVPGQEPYCKNLGFELGNFTNWEGYIWDYSNVIDSITTPPYHEFLPTFQRHVIMADTAARDPFTGNELRKVPKGYRYSARLGYERPNTSRPIRFWNQSLRYTMTIDSANALLITKFALVLEYGTHGSDDEARFRLTLYDQNGDVIPDCANYDVYASNSSVTGFKYYTPPGEAKRPVSWRDWVSVGADLSKYIGQTITIEFMTADCTHGGHFGYAYFVASCQPMSIKVQYCTGDSIARLTAPEGFEKYSWTNSSGMVVDTLQVLNIPDPIPVEGATYQCALTSATGCKVVLKSTVAKHLVKVDFNSSMVDCKSNKVQFSNLSTTNQGSLFYKWDFGEGITSTERNPLHTFATSGLHEVSLELNNPSSTCKNETLTKTVESFSPPLVGISSDSTYCEGLSFFLKAYGAYKYNWSNGSTADSIKVNTSGVKYWLLGHSSTGCISDTVYKTVTKEPDWMFVLESDSALCKGDSLVLKLSGAARYLWNTNDTTNSIKVTKPGTYTVTGSNARGCILSKSIVVKEFPPPKTDFTASASILDRRHNQISCTLPAQPDVRYTWDMGDGSTETGSTIQHSYNIPSSVQEYMISLTATSKYGCTASISKIVDVVPFIPNVFSPNGDGINDVFMEEMELQVFDRYGTLLYKGTAGWDGTYKGQPVDADTYFYLIHYTDKFQQAQTRKGYITLVR